ncbi:MAG: DUF3047 domain-containing protein [Pseudomonadota bacterium]
MLRRSTLALALSLTALPAFAGPVSFSGWKEQKFFRTADNDYAFRGGSLGIASDQGVSVAYSALGQDMWDKRAASWNWSVSQSVPPTDLSVKGGDDRNISLYFVFMDRASAERAGPNPRLRSLLGNKNARMLVYVWGGDHSRGQVLASPYLDTRGKTLIRRAAGTGSFSESVDLAEDYAKAFGGAPDALVGVAVSADSDDTASAIRAEVSGLVLR